MEQTDNIDIILTLESHGWSTCFFFIKGKALELGITHVLGDPYTDLIKALSALINKQDFVFFIWYDEPGGHRIRINRISTQQHKVVVSIESFAELNSFNLQLEFEIKIKQLITIFYYQLQKTHSLLKDGQFARDRAKDFPFEAFHQFDRLVTTQMNI